MKTVEDVREELRDKVIKQMLMGKVLIFDVGTVSPEILVTPADNFPANDIWDYAKWSNQ